MRIPRLTLICSLLAQTAYAQGALENPEPGSPQSGIGQVSGWHCAARAVTVSFDGGVPLPAATGISRKDTRGACDDDNNGFVLQWNWNILGDGIHTVRAFADGVEFGRATVEVTTFGEEFLRGARAQCRVERFPEADRDTILTWQEGLQNFTVTDVVPTGGGSFPGGNSTWGGVAESAVGVAPSGVACSGAEVAMRITAPTVSGALVTDVGVELSVAGEIGSDGMMRGRVRRGGEFFGVFTGQVEGDEVEGEWVDVLGCFGSFHLEQQ
jgi:hypothetical protein